MATRNAERRVAAIQELGGAPDGEQTDRARSAVVRIASGDRVLLSVVADGSGRGGGEAAARAVEQIFQVVQASRPRELAAALRRGLEIADQGLRKSPADSSARALVALSAAVIWRNRLHCAHVGNSFAVHVTDGRATSLTQTDSERLGADRPPQIQTRTVQLRRGDRVVLASDGLMRQSPETGRPFVDHAEIAQHASELPPNEAARHLVSLALGRDVDDNVSVAVLALPGRAQRERALPWPALAAAVLLIGVAIAGALVLNRPNASPSTDYGFAVLVDGGVLADQGSGTPELVPNLGTIPSGSFLTASTDAKLGLQSTFQGGSRAAQGTLYLEQAARLELTSVDPRLANDDPPPQGSDLTLDAGRLLVVRESGTWEIRVHGQGATASLMGVGHAAIGIATDANGFTMTCIAGTCGYAVQGSERRLVQAGEMVPTPASAGSDPAEVLAEELLRWDVLCGGCLLNGS